MLPGHCKLVRLINLVDHLNCKLELIIVLCKKKKRKTKKKKKEETLILSDV